MFRKDLEGGKPILALVCIRPPARTAAARLSNTVIQLLIFIVDVASRLLNFGRGQLSSFKDLLFLNPSMYDNSNQDPVWVPHAYNKSSRILIISTINY